LEGTPFTRLKNSISHVGGMRTKGSWSAKSAIHWKINLKTLDVANTHFILEKIKGESVDLLPHLLMGIATDQFQMLKGGTPNYGGRGKINLPGWEHAPPF